MHLTNDLTVFVRSRERTNDERHRLTARQPSSGTIDRMPDDHYPLIPRRNPENFDLGTVRTGGFWATGKLKNVRTKDLARIEELAKKRS